jgi:hypothetical protein
MYDGQTAAASIAGKEDEEDGGESLLSSVAFISRRVASLSSLPLPPRLSLSRRLCPAPLSPPHTMFPTKRAPPRLSTSDIARRIFLKKHNLQLVPGVLEWLEELVQHFDIQSEEDIVSTFEHLVRGCQGSGSGLGSSPPPFPQFELMKGEDGPVKITVELLETTYERLRVSADQPVDDEGGDDLDSSHYLKIVNAFDMPAWRWGEESKGFEK